MIAVISRCLIILKVPFLPWDYLYTNKYCHLTKMEMKTEILMKTNHDNINNTWETPMLITDEIQYFKARSQIQSKNNIEL